MTEKWSVDLETCIAKHHSGFAVRFQASDILPNAVVGEIIASPPGTNEDALLLLKEAGTAYASVRASRH